MSWPALYGKAHVDRVLTGSVALKRLHHAYLFEGPTASGKTYLATRTAAAFLCREKGMYGPNRSADTIAPCGECRNCKRILTHNHPDLVWFDDLTVERSDRTQAQVAQMKQVPLEAIQQLMSSLSRRPIEGDRRAVVMRRVERLNATAQNAFLKLLEEPPRGTLFLMTCTNTQQVLKTILSRCQRLTVRLLTEAEIAGALVAEGVPARQAEAVSVRSEGRVGTALAVAAAGPAALAALSTSGIGGGGGAGMREACTGWLDLLTGSRGLSQTGLFAAEILAAIQAQLEAAPMLPSRGDDAGSADNGDDDGGEDSSADDGGETTAPAVTTKVAGKKSAKAGGSKVTANEAVRLAAQKAVGDLAYTWHRAWRLSQGESDPAGTPPMFPPPSPALIVRAGLQPITLVHGWFEEAVAALQYNVRTELVLKALAVRLAR